MYVKCQTSNFDALKIFVYMVVHKKLKTKGENIQVGNT